MYEVLKGADSGDHPTVIIKTHAVPPGLRADDVDVAEVARQVVPSGAPVSDVHDGPNWRTCVFLGHVDNAKIVALYRIGLQDGEAVEAVFIFPLPNGKPEELALLTVDGQADEQGRTTGVYAPLQSTYEMISIFNDFTKTLTINGKTSFHARAVMAKPTEKPTAVYRWIDSPASSASTGG